MSSRQRRPKKGGENGKKEESNDGDDNKAEPIDEVLQSQQVQRLREEAYEQMDLFHNIFSRVCEGAMFLCLIMGISMGHQDAACWIHVVISVLLHFSAITIAKPSHGSSKTDAAGGYQRFLPIIALLILVGVFVPHAISTNNNNNMKKNKNSDNNDDYLHHLGLAGSNAITMLVALYLKKDVENTNQQIDELEKSKYHYKSL